MTDRPAPTPSTVRRRLLFAIPTAETVVGLGRRLRSRTQPGFTASTTRHVWLKAARNGTFQAQGQAWFQSEAGPLYVMSGLDIYMAADQDGVLLGAKGSVAVMAGFAGEPVATDNGGADVDPGDPVALAGIRPALRVHSFLWPLIHRVTNLALLGRMAHRYRSIDHSATDLATYLPLVAMATNVAGHAYWIIGRSLAETGVKPPRSVSLFSQAGILSGTAAFCSIYGGVGAVARSLNATIFGLVGVDVKSPLNAAVESLHSTAISSGISLSAESWGRMGVQATQGTLTMQGATMSFGDPAAEAPQLPTATLSLKSVSNLEMETETPGGITNESAGILSIRGALGAQTKVLQATAIKVGPWSIRATAGMITISSGNALVTLTAASVTIGGPAAAQLNLTPAATTIGPGLVTLTPAAQIITAPATELL